MRSLSAGSTGGVRRWAIVAGWVSTVGLNGFEPLPWLAYGLVRVVARGIKARESERLRRWNWPDLRL
jgi:hypothetical protein